jgi:RNA polymerase sigma factor (sigma-70 family)
MKRPLHRPRSRSSGPEVAPATPPPLLERWLLLVQYRPRLVALAISRGAAVDAEDLAQEALLRAALSERLEEGQPWPYLAATVANLVIDNYRRSNRDLRLHNHPGLLPPETHVEDDIAGRDEIRRALKLAIESTSTETIAMAWRRYADGMTWQDVGREFGRTGSAVESEVRRAFVRLRRKLAYGRGQ